MQDIKSPSKLVHLLTNALNARTNFEPVEAWRHYPMHWRGVGFKYHHECITPSQLYRHDYRLRNSQLKRGKKVIFLCKYLVRSQCHIIEAYAEGEVIFYHRLLVHEIIIRCGNGFETPPSLGRDGRCCP